MYILDIDTCIAYIESNEKVTLKVITYLSKCYIPSIVIAELYSHIHRLNPHQQERVDKFCSIFPSIDFDKKAAIKYGNLYRNCEFRPQRIHLQIASIAKAYDAVIVTSNQENYLVIESSIKCEDWLDDLSSPQFLFNSENRPGLLYRLSKILKDLEINIEEFAGSCHNSNNIQYCHNNKISITLRCTVNIDIQQLIHDLENEGFSIEENINSEIFYEGQKFKILIGIDDYTHDTGAYRRLGFLVRGHDRVGLVSDIAYPLFRKGYNVERFVSYLENGSSNSNIFCVHCMFAWENDSMFSPIGSDLKDEIRNEILSISELTDFTWLPSKNS